MIALYLIAAHLVGDFVFQTRWQAAGKFGWSTDAMKFRFVHAGTYALAFVPVVAVSWPGWELGAGFLAWLWLLHYLTDSRRFTSTLGDWIAWHLAPDPDPELPVALPPNPWSPISILIDQALHLVQISVLAGLFLS